MKLRIYPEGCGDEAVVVDAGDLPLGAVVARHVEALKFAGTVVVEPADKAAETRFGGSWHVDEDGLFALYKSTATTHYEVSREYRAHSPVRTAT
jgi:hypothetical protein